MTTPEANRALDVLAAVVEPVESPLLMPPPRRNGSVSLTVPQLQSSSGSPGSACLPLHVFAQRSIDPCLIALIGCRVALEPGNDIGIEAERQLLLDGSIEKAALGPGPVKELRRIRCIDGVIGERRERLQLRLPLGRQPRQWHAPADRP
jgi:hypothetical protein